jgi:hypothetical protein
MTSRMSKSEERDYKTVCAEMTDQTLALASRVAAQAVQRGVPYRLACHAIKVALYQGVFSATLRGMKNESDMPQSLKMEEAFVTPSHHEYVAHEIIKMIFDHLRMVDRRYIWAMNIVKRKAKPGENDL